MQAYAVRAFPTYEKEFASKTQLRLLCDAMRARAFEAVPGTREAYERATARARVLDDVEAAVRDADGGIDAFVRATDANGATRSFDLRHATVDRWSDFVCLRGLLPLSCADPAAALADWVAFRDELLEPRSLAPHDWVCLKRFAL